MEHWYGLPEALFDDKTVQDYPLDYNYQNEQHRFEEAGKLWCQSAKPYSEHWNNVMEELLALDFTLDPTFNIYEASRDLHRARRAEWHEDYTLPSLWRFYQPSKISHGSYWHFWGTEQEIAWKNIYSGIFRDLDEILLPMEIAEEDGRLPLKRGPKALQEKGIPYYHLTKKGILVGLAINGIENMSLQLKEFFSKSDSKDKEF